MKKRKSLILSLLLIIISLLSSCNFIETLSVQSNDILYVRIYLPLSESYFLKLSDDKTFFVAKGKGSLEQFENMNVDFSSSKMITLDNDQYNNIISMINELGDFKKSEDIVFDYWTIDINCHGKKHTFVYGCSNPSSYDELIFKLVELSPIKIKDNAGNLISPFSSKSQ